MLRASTVVASSLLLSTRHSFGLAFAASQQCKMSAAPSAPQSSFDFTVQDARGKPFALSQLKDKKAILVVNVASECGFTPQYKGLQELQDKYSNRGFTVLAFPCNQFGGQEPGSAPEVCSWAKDKFKATFPIMDKVEVNGKGTDPFWVYLKQSKSGMLGTEGIKWNFSKFLLKDGVPVKRYGSNETPAAIEKDIIAIVG